MSFSIKQLLLLTFFVAAALVAMANAGRPFVPGAVQMLLFVVLAVIAYGIWFTTGERRAFRIGFLCWVIATGTYGMTGAGNPFLFFAPLVDEIAPLFRPKAYDDPPVRQEVVPGLVTFTHPGLVEDHLWPRNLHRVCYSLFPLLWGLIGGYVTVFCYRKKLQIAKAQRPIESQ